MLKIKSVVLTLVFAVSVLVAAPAHAFSVYAQAVVNPYQVAGQVMNSFPQPVFCSIRVQGVRNDGFTLWATANTGIYPGMYGYAYVYTSYPFNFVNGQAWADCSFAGRFGFSEEELALIGE